MPCPLLSSREAEFAARPPGKACQLVARGWRARRAGFGHLGYPLYLPLSLKGPAIVPAYHFSLLSTCPPVQAQSSKARNTKFEIRNSVLQSACRKLTNDCFPRAAGLHEAG